MSSRQTVVLASRVLCVYLLFWVISNLVDLPADVFALHQYWSVEISYDRHLMRLYSLRLEALILKTALELFFAGLFYCCGPRISQFLTGGSAEFDSAKVDPAT